MSLSVNFINPGKNVGKTRIIVSKALEKGKRQSALKAGVQLANNIQNDLNTGAKNVVVKIAPKYNCEMVRVYSIEKGFWEDVPYITKTDKIEVSVRKKGFINKLKAILGDGAKVSEAKNNSALGIFSAGMRSYKKLCKK